MIKKMTLRVNRLVNLKEELMLSFSEISNIEYFEENLFDQWLIDNNLNQTDIAKFEYLKSDQFRKILLKESLSLPPISFEEISNFSLSSSG